MRHLPHSVNYSNADDLMKEFDNLSIAEIKNFMKDVIEDNGKLVKVSERAAIALDQYKELVSLVDGTIFYDVMDDQVLSKEKAENYIAEIGLRLIFSMKNTSYWLVILSEIMEKYTSKDTEIRDLILILKGMSEGILTASEKLKYKHPIKRRKSGFRNLERSKKIIRKRKLEETVSLSSPENKGNKNGNIVEKSSEVMDEEPDKSFPLYNENLAEEDATSVDQQVETVSDKEVTSGDEVETSAKELKEIAVKPSANVSVSNTNEDENENGHLQNDSSSSTNYKERCKYSKKHMKRSKKKENIFVNTLRQSETENLQSVAKKQLRSIKVSVTECEPEVRRKSIKDSFNVESETTPKSSISSEQHQRRGRKRKTDMPKEIMKKKDRNDYALKYACVHLSNVLDDPNVQHFADISTKQEKLSTKLKEKQNKYKLMKHTKISEDDDNI